MNKKVVVLDNGIELIMLNTNKFKNVNVTLFFEDELNDYNVTCDNLLIKTLSEKTSVHSSRKELKSYLKELYDMKINYFKDAPGDTFLFALNTDALNKKYTMNGENLLEKQFELLNEILYSPLVSDNKFNEDYFKESKNLYKQVLVDKGNYKESVVTTKVNKVLGENNKLFVITGGYLDKLESITNDDLYAKYLKLNSLCSKIVVCGEIDFDEVESYVKKYLKFDSNRNSFKYLFKNDLQKYEDKSYESKFGQSSIGVVYDLDVYVGDKLYYPAIIFTEMFNHYLFKIVREEHNFCYSIYTIYMSSRGICYMQSNIEEKNYEMTLKLANDIINDLRNNIDEKVLKICKDKIINGYRREVDNPVKMTLNEYQRYIYKLNDVDKVIEICKNITGDDIKSVASMMEKKFSVILKEGN